MFLGRCNLLGLYSADVGEWNTIK